MLFFSILNGMISCMSKTIVTVRMPFISEQSVTCEFIVNSTVYTNTYTFPKTVPNTMNNSRILRWLGIATSLGMFSIDYFDEVHCDFSLSKEEVTFFEILFYQGLGEFRYVNNISITKKTKVIPKILDEVNPAAIYTPTLNKSLKPLLLNGGGKDGSASAYVLSKTSIDFTWFQRGNSKAQSNVTSEWNSPVFTVIRKLDDRRKNGKYKGHRPMSAGIAMLSLFSAQAFGFTHVIASNEASANEGNMVIDGFSLNHQYSKSLEFEKDLGYLLEIYKVDVVYFSLLRSLHELQIGAIVTKLEPNQLKAITSCNQGTSTGTWCMACAKCAFVVLVITALNASTTESIFGDRLAINIPELLPFIVELVDPKYNKPLECVGTLLECQVALGLVTKLLGGELSKDLADLAAANSVDVQKTNEIMHQFSENLVPKDYKRTNDMIFDIVGSYTY